MEYHTDNPQRYLKQEEKEELWKDMERSLALCLSGKIEHNAYLCNLTITCSRLHQPCFPSKGYKTILSLPRSQELGANVLHQSMQTSHLPPNKQISNPLSPQ